VVANAEKSHQMQKRHGQPARDAPV